MKVPTAVPAKFRQHILHWDDERNEGGSIVVTLRGLRLDGPGTGDGSKTSHVFGEDTVREVIDTLRFALPCKCAKCAEVTP